MIYRCYICNGEANYIDLDSWPEFYESMRDAGHPPVRNGDCEGEEAARQVCLDTEAEWERLGL